MKITIELSGVKCTIEKEHAEDIQETFELIVYALKGIGFSDSVIENGVKTIEV